MSDCFTVPDDAIQLQIVTALLAGVTATHSDVHEGSLLTAVRTIYNIYLNPKTAENSEKALDALEQILTVVYKRMETASVEEAMDALEAEGGDEAGGVPAPPPAVGEADPEGVVVELPEEGEGAAQSEPPPIAADGPEPEQEPEPEPEPEAAPPAPPELLDSSRRGSLPSLAAAAAQPDTSAAEDDDSAEVAGATFPNIFQKDGYLLFRALCKLSMKPVTKEHLPDSVPVRSKLQALVRGYAIPVARRLSALRVHRARPWTRIRHHCLRLFG